MIPYSLRIISYDKPDTPAGIFLSAQMMGWGLWSAFKNMQHVTLRYQNSEEQPQCLMPVHFSLLHTYFDSPIYSNLAAVRASTLKSIINVMEASHSGADYNFTFLKRSGCGHLPFPIVQEFLDKDTGTCKWPGSILLDHKISEELDPDYSNWSEWLYEWLAPLAGSRKIGQLRRPEWESENSHFPQWISSIPQSNYLDYLERTAQYETFIMTHPESYGHSIVDMIARGIKSLFPRRLASRLRTLRLLRVLKLTTFSSGEELTSLLNRAPSLKNWRRLLCTDAAEIARRVDEYCQSILMANS